jgi:hypothetical protein
VSLLEATLDEEKAADQKLTEIAETVVNLDAAGSDEDESDAEEGTDRSGQSARGRSVSSASGRRSAASRPGRR